MKLEQLQTLDSSSRLFVYTADSEISNDYKYRLVAKLDQFSSTWEAHGVKLNAAYELIVDRMLIIAVDERNQQATGCSIDKLVHLLKGEEVDWFNRMNVHFAENETWKTLHIMDLLEKVKSGELSDNIKVLNSTVLTLSEAEGFLIQTLKKSWLNNMI